MRYTLNTSEKFGYIYGIRHIVSARCYIGSTVNYKTRFKDHKVRLRANRHGNRYLQNMWNKYGENAFEFVLLLRCSIIDLVYWEQYYIDYYQPELNILKNATSPLGVKRTEEFKEKMQIIGLNRSLETRRKISQALTGRKLSESHRRKTIIARALSSGFTGKHHTEETKQLISFNKTGVRQSDETKRKRARSCQGKTNGVWKTSRYIGVCYRKKYNDWCARITVNKKSIHLGIFINEIDAAKAYDKAAKFYFGNDAKVNFPQSSSLMQIAA